MLKSVFLTATAQGVGKTYIAALMLRDLGRLGAAAGYFRPVLTAPSIEESDLAFIRANCDVNQELSEMTGCFIPSQLSVFAAVRASRRYPDLETITKQYAWNMSTHSCMVIEGEAGVVSPIVLEQGRVLMQDDLIRRLRAQCIILVAKAGAGALSHCVSAVAALRALGHEVSGIILNGYDEMNPQHRDNLGAVEFLSRCRVIATVPVNAGAIGWRVDLLDLLEDEEQV